MRKETGGCLFSICLLLRKRMICLLCNMIYLLHANMIGSTSSNPCSATSIVATPHCGACSFSDDLTSDGISATGCPQRFAPLGHRFLRSPRHALNDTVFGAVMSPITFPNVYGLGDFPATSIVAAHTWSALTARFS